MSFVEQLHAKRYEALKGTTEWDERLGGIRGAIGSDGVERISTQAVFDVLGIPQRQRASAARRLAAVMRALGWSSIRARGLTRGGFSNVVRGYARDARTRTAAPGF